MTNIKLVSQLLMTAIRSLYLDKQIQFKFLNFFEKLNFAEIWNLKEKCARCFSSRL